MKRLKKFTALICALGMLMSTWVIPQAAISAEPVLKVDFDSGSSYTLNSGATLVDGRDGKAVLTSNTSASYASINDVSAISGITSDFTFSVWCYPTVSDVWWSRLYDIGDGTDNYIFLASSLGNNIPRFAIKKDGVEQSFDSTKALNLNAWNNVTVTRSGSVSTMYINGIMSGSSTAITFNPSDINTGNNYLAKSQWPDAYFDGMIDDFRVYDTALTDTEVQELAAEAYEEEMRKIVELYDRYYIDVNFYDNNGTEVYQAKAGEILNVTAKVKNYTSQSSNINVQLLNGSTVIAENSADILIAQEKEIKLSAAAPSAASQLKVVVSDEYDVSYDAAYIDVTSSLVVFPDASPADTDETTFGAHDPTIYKDPVSGKYWAYSSHNLVYESEDLINWTEHDYTKTVTVPAKAKSFIETNFGSNATANGTYWAPDLLYKPDDEYPYWFYLSVSCYFDNNGNGIEDEGDTGGGQNSVICLVKAKSPGLWDGETEDCGVVIASRGTALYNTNAIDANIYTENGVNYFIWGSFWKGIHGAKLTDDGMIDGIDYTSDTTILTSSQDFGSRLFATPGGIMGPEGAFTIKNTDNDYTYMFTSYGWLGTNYNCRIARTSTEMSNIIGGSNPHTIFVDANGNRVGVTYAQQTDLSLPWGYKMIGSYKIGDGITYYGNGHNSVLHDDDGNWYYVQHSRKVADAAAYLQVRKMLWTAEGWPVVSPVVYAGETEQAVTETMLYGTWDITSVGHTIYADGVTSAGDAGAYKGADMPVESFEVILKPDGTFEKGTWAFDGDHTVTLTFTRDGSEAANEYFLAGDVMTLFVLPGYDKDAERSVLTVTGTDNHYITNFGIKASGTAVATAPSAIETTPIAVEKSAGGNPELGFDADGNVLYGGDPAATVIGDTVYLVVGHDTSAGESYSMPDWVMYTSKDMVNWTYEGSVMSASSISWRNDNTSAWASQMIEHNGKYYLYFCTWDKTSSGYQSIGVAVADSPTGPYVDIGQPLVKGTDTVAPAAEASTFNDIDPTVWVETIDGVEHRYLGWGNNAYYICELNEDMISVKDKNSDGKIDMYDIKLQTIADADSEFTEAPWLYKRGDKYYTFYAANWREAMAYATSDDLSSNRWQYGGIIMPPTATSNTNHPSVIDFNGKTYFIYHNGALPHGSGFRRSVCIQELEFDGDGNVIPLTEMSTGLTGTSTTILDRSGNYIGHEEFTNSYADEDYPIKKSVIISETEDALNTAWEIVPGLADKSNEYYISIQAVNKPGLYIGVKNSDVVLTQESTGDMGKQLTFKTVAALDGGDGVSFESIEAEGMFLTSSIGTLTLSYGREPEKSSFVIGGAVSPTPTPTLAPIPTKSPEATMCPDVNNTFEGVTADSSGRIVVQSAALQTYSTDGATLYSGARDGGGDPNTGWYLADAGVSGKAIVLQSERWANSSRGARIAFDTPYIPVNGSAKLEISIKVDSGSINYNDSVLSDSGAVDITSYFTAGEYNTFTSEIKNVDGTYVRTIAVNGTEISTSFAWDFPVIWGTLTDENNVVKKIYFDNLAITSVAAPVIEPLAATVTELAKTDAGASFVLNNAAVFGSVDAVIAQYDASGVLLRLDKASIAVTGNTQPVSVNYKAAENAVKTKLYIWYDMMPAAAVSVVE